MLFILLLIIKNSYKNKTFSKITAYLSKFIFIFKTNFNKLFIHIFLKEKRKKNLLSSLAPPNFLAPEDLQSLSLFIYNVSPHISYKFLFLTFRLRKWNNQEQEILKKEKQIKKARERIDRGWWWAHPLFPFPVCSFPLPPIEAFFHKPVIFSPSPSSNGKFFSSGLLLLSPISRKVFEFCCLI